MSGQEERWDLVGQAKRAGLVFLGSDDFAESDWPGYIVKRNTSGTPSPAVNALPFRFLTSGSVCRAFLQEYQDKKVSR